MTRKEEFDSKGYVVLRGAMDPDSVQQCIQAIDALRPAAKKKTWTRGDGVTQYPDLWPVIFNGPTLDVVRELIGDQVKFLQHNDIHFGFSSFAWHRDSVNRKYGNLPNWREEEEPYRLVRVGYYFQPPDGGFKLGMIPGSHRPGVHYDASRRKRVERRISDLSNITAKAMGTDRFAGDAEWIRTEPGDAVIFDPRVIHTGSDFDGDKYSVFVAYGENNRHFQEHYQYYRYLRKDLGYADIPSELRESLTIHGLYGGEGQTIEHIDGAWIPGEVFNYLSSFFK